MEGKKIETEVKRSTVSENFYDRFKQNQQEDIGEGEDEGQDLENVLWAKFDLIFLSNSVPSCRSKDRIRRFKKAPDSSTAASSSGIETLLWVRAKG